MDEAATRRARLKALREAAEAVDDQQRTQGAAAPTQDAVEPPKEPVLKFRNYAVRDEKIAHEKASHLTPLAHI